MLSHQGVALETRGQPLLPRQKALPECNTDGKADSLRRARSPEPHPPLAMSDALPDQSLDAVSPECRPCGLRFESLRSLCLHRSARHSVLSFSSCSKEYAVAPDQNGYACPLGNCSQLYRNRGSLQRHLRKQHGVKSGVPNPSTSSSGGRLHGTASDRPFTPPLDEPVSLSIVGRVSNEWGQGESHIFSQGHSNGTACIPNLSGLPGDAELKGTLSDLPFAPPHDEPSSNVVGDISSERGQGLVRRTKNGECVLAWIRHTSKR
ncbi:hypothetical protein EV363DRAFT_1187478 [Boletus edulis]|uniref:C2H2-type domain-containing protein n=1 Tax=Boletus edulis BED1 TaxID=1328754 RepID=A0AAD4B9J8_BOLED|nr:hypothetical protein EV363DRAFT_1187478 [Boletus edulis]KAF8414347.1 hypothetical protein L210DRAFT_3659496 [Boletus edulis BED1]